MENIIQGRLQLYNSDKYSKFEEFIFYFCQNEIGRIHSSIDQLGYKFSIVLLTNSNHIRILVNQCDFKLIEDE